MALSDYSSASRRFVNDSQTGAVNDGGAAGQIGPVAPRGIQPVDDTKVPAGRGGAPTLTAAAGPLEDPLGPGVDFNPFSLSGQGGSAGGPGGGQGSRGGFGPTSQLLQQLQQARVQYILNWHKRYGSM